VFEKNHQILVFLFQTIILLYRSLVENSRRFHTPEIVETQMVDGRVDIRRKMVAGLMSVILEEE